MTPTTRNQARIPFHKKTFQEVRLDVNQVVDTLADMKRGVHEVTVIAEEARAGLMTRYPDRVSIAHEAIMLGWVVRQFNAAVKVSLELMDMAEGAATLKSPEIEKHAIATATLILDAYQRMKQLEDSGNPVILMRLAEIQGSITDAAFRTVESFSHVAASTPEELFARLSLSGQ